MDIRRLRIFKALLLCVVSLAPPSLHAEDRQLRIARQYGIGYLQMMVMEHEGLIEKHAKARGLGDVVIRWSTFADGTGASDAFLSGNLDLAAGGLGSFVTLWDRTRGGLGVKGIAALNSMPMLLNSRDPRIRSIRDLTQADRIAVAGVKVSSQATTLQLAASQAFGRDNWNKLDHLTVNMGHPTGMQMLLQGNNAVVAHFASPPFQYQELERPGIHTVLDSYDVWGGPQTFILVWTTSQFRARNPRMYDAILSALKEATDFINHDRRAAAKIYVEMTKGSDASVDEYAKMLANPRLRFTLAPENVVRFALFKADAGTVRARPESWKDLFFAEIHDLPGS